MKKICKNCKCEFENRASDFCSGECSLVSYNGFVLNNEIE